MIFDVITIFPGLFSPYLNESLLKRAQKKELIKFRVHNLRDYTTDRHHKVDGRPYGGGPGMILRADVIIKCFGEITGYGLRVKRRTSRNSSLDTRHSRTRVIALDPAGKQLTQSTARRLAKYNRLILLCGRYEGFDERVYKFVDEKISIGPYVLAGGELPALVVIDAVSRMIPGVVGDPDSTLDETHSAEGYIEYPQYTRPEQFMIFPQRAGPRRRAVADFTCLPARQGFQISKKFKQIVNHKSKIINLKVPRVLLSGNHKKIREWRKKHSRTRIN